MSLRIVASFLVLAFGLALPAHAGQWSKTYPLSGKADLWVSTGDGEVRLDVWDEPRIEARLETVGYEINKDFQLIESQAGNQVRIEARFPKMNWTAHVGRHSLILTLKVPRESNLDLHTGDGTISVTGAKGEMRLHTGDGRIDATNLDGRLTASSGDGTIHVDGRFDLLDLHTGDGTVEAAAKPGSTTTSSWSIRTGDGPVTLRLAADVRANIDAHTGDGAITFDVPVAVTGTVKRSQLQGTLNGGGGALLLRTGDGEIRVAKY